MLRKHEKKSKLHKDNLAAAAAGRAPEAGGGGGGLRSSEAGGAEGYGVAVGGRGR